MAGAIQKHQVTLTRQITDGGFLNARAVMSTTLIWTARHRLKLHCKIELFFLSVFQPTAMPIWQQRLQRIPLSFLPLLLTTSIDYSPLCCFYLTRNHQTTQFPAFSLHLYTTLIHSLKLNLPSIARGRWGTTLVYAADGCHQNSVKYQRCSVLWELFICISRFKTRTPRKNNGC